MDNFCVLVKQMRDAQKEYFKNRTPENLKTAKDLEAKVDQFYKTDKKIGGTEKMNFNN